MSSGNAATVSSEETDRLRLALLRVVRQIRARYTGDVTPSQIAVLTSLFRHGPSSIGQIAEYEQVQPPSASRIVSALEERGLVTRSAGHPDRRCTTITLSPQGTTYLEGLRAAGTSWLQSRLAELEPADVDALRLATPALERLLEGIE
jgi:DNA-binding MarR family transcriptional regulator